MPYPSGYYHPEPHDDAHRLALEPPLPPPPSMRGVREVARRMRAAGEGEARVSSDPYQRILERNNDRRAAPPRRLNRNERFSRRVLNRRERKKLDRAREDFWLRGPNVRGGYIVHDKDEEEEEGGGAEEELDDEAARGRLLEDHGYEPLEVCGRPADAGTAEDLAALRRFARCPEITPDRPILILNGRDAWGRTGNNLVELLHAIQYARDKDVQLGIGVHSWAMDVVQGMWLSAESDDWEGELESALCAKIFHDKNELRAWEDRNNTVYVESRELFIYGNNIDRPLGEYTAGQEHVLRTLFRHYNDGGGVDHGGSPVRDVCTGIDALFGARRKHAIYSAIHARSLEGAPGRRMMNRLARHTGCDPNAALRMEPEYVKSILRPLGMMAYPVVVITDGQDPSVLQRLLDDEEIGSIVYVVPPEASWYGGDMALAIMSNVFIGNPVSTFSAFIAKARLSLGFGHNYLFRAKDENGEWRTVCGDNCLFDKAVVGPMA